MINNPKFVMDGFSTLLGGVDESRQPLLLAQNQLHRAVNLTMRGGFLRTRPGFDKLPLRFARGEYASWFYNRRFQGAAYFDDLRDMEKIVASIGGRIFQIDPTAAYLVTDITPRGSTITTANFTAQDPLTDIVVQVADATRIFEGYPIYINGKEYSVISRSGLNLTVRNMEEDDAVVVASGAVVEYLDPNSPDQPMAWFVQAEQYLIIQDDQSAAIIYDGASSRRARAGEIVSGSAMAYGRGRIWVAVNNGREFVAGDIAGGPTGVLGFAENTYLAGGGTFRIGSNVGRIRAMRFVMNLDTSLGQGPLQVLCDRAIYSINAPTQRELWAVMRDPIQTESLINFGATGQYSTVLINGDLFFRAEDGVRSFFISRRDFGMWGNTPISREMSTLLDQDTPNLLGHSAAVLWENRLLFTTSPAPSDTGVYHRGVIALDFDLISTLKGKEPPAFDGLWTGMKVKCFVTGRFFGRNRCFAFTHSEAGKNELWEVSRNSLYDNGTNQIEWAWESRSFSFPSQGIATGLKKATAQEVWISDFVQELTMTLSYRSDQNPCWQEIATKNVCITSDQCDDDDPCASTTSSNLHGYKTRIAFGMPPDTNNAPDEKAMRLGFSFQYRMAGTGFMQMNLFRAQAHVEEELPFGDTAKDRSVCTAIACCPPDPFEYVADCGALDAPMVTLSLASLGSVDVSFYAVAGVNYEIWLYDGVSESILTSVSFSESGFDGVDALSVPGVASGTEVQIWIVSNACGNQTSQRTTLKIIF